MRAPEQERRSPPFRAPSKLMKFQEFGFVSKAVYLLLQIVQARFAVCAFARTPTERKTILRPWTRFCPAKVMSRGTSRLATHTPHRARAHTYTHHRQTDKHKHNTHKQVICHKCNRIKNDSTVEDLASLFEWMCQVMSKNPVKLLEEARGKRMTTAMIAAEKEENEGLLLLLLLLLIGKSNNCNTAHRRSRA